MIKILAAWMLADFLSGVVHWWEDRYLKTTREGILGRIARDNELHHQRPRAMLANPVWDNMEQSAVLAWAVALIALPFSPLLALAFFFLGFGNAAHRYTHEMPRKIPPPIRALQRVGLFSSARTHHRHHYDKGQVTQKNLAHTNFCVMSDWLNPVLDRLGFWRQMNRIFG